MQKLSLEALNRLTIDEFRASEKFPFSIVLENIRSLNNVGSFFRTADAFRVQKLYLTGYTPQPPHREITRSALGAELSVAWEHSPDALGLIRELKAEGHRIVAVEQTENSRLLQDFTPEANSNYVFVFGNEVEGVSQEVINESDYALEIPQFGTKHSLNVSVCAGIVLWEFAKNAINTSFSRPSDTVV